MLSLTPDQLAFITHYARMIQDSCDRDKYFAEVAASLRQYQNIDDELVRFAAQSVFRKYNGDLES
jgi:hypothetical protein